MNSIFTEYLSTDGCTQRRKRPKECPPLGSFTRPKKLQWFDYKSTIIPLSTIFRNCVMGVHFAPHSVPSFLAWKHQLLRHSGKLHIGECTTARWSLWKGWAAQAKWAKVLLRIMCKQWNFDHIQAAVDDVNQKNAIRVNLVDGPRLTGAGDQGEGY